MLTRFFVELRGSVSISCDLLERASSKLDSEKLLGVTVELRSGFWDIFSYKLSSFSSDSAPFILSHAGTISIISALFHRFLLTSAIFSLSSSFESNLLVPWKKDEAFRKICATYTRAKLKSNIGTVKKHLKEYRRCPSKNFLVTEPLFPISWSSWL